MCKKTQPIRSYAESWNSAAVLFQLQFSTSHKSGSVRCRRTWIIILYAYVRITAIRFGFRMRARQRDIRFPRSRDYARRCEKDPRDYATQYVTHIVHVQNDIVEWIKTKNKNKRPSVYAIGIIFECEPSRGCVSGIAPVRLIIIARIMNSRRYFPRDSRYYV